MPNALLYIFFRDRPFIKEITYELLFIAWISCRAKNPFCLAVLDEFSPGDFLSTA